jgi:hypothetical protein
MSSTNRTVGSVLAVPGGGRLHLIVRTIILFAISSAEVRLKSTGCAKSKPWQMLSEAGGRDGERHLLDGS